MPVSPPIAEDGIDLMDVPITDLCLTDKGRAALAAGEFDGIELATIDGEPVTLADWLTVIDVLHAEREAREEREDMIGALRWLYRARARAFLGDLRWLVPSAFGVIILGR